MRFLVSTDVPAWLWPALVALALFLLLPAVAWWGMHLRRAARFAAAACTTARQQLRCRLRRKLQRLIQDPAEK